MVNISRELENLRKSVYKVALRMLTSREDAQDAVQEVFMNCLRKPFENNDHLRRYVFKAVYHQCLDMIRKRGCDPCHGNDIEIGEFDSGERVDKWIDEMISPEVADILNTLRPEPRRLVELRYIENLSYADIGATVGLDAMRVRERVRTARRTMSNTVNRTKSTVG